MDKKELEQLKSILDPEGELKPSRKAWDRKTKDLTLTEKQGVVLGLEMASDVLKSILDPNDEKTRVSLRIISALIVSGSEDLL